MTYSFSRQLGIAIDQLANVGTGGYADETMSARAYRTHAKGKRFGMFFMPIIDWMFSWQGSDPEVDKEAGRVILPHCERAWWKEKLRRDNHPEYRETQSA